RKMDSERRRKKVASILAEDLKEAEDMKIEGTPYFLVNNLVIRGAVSKDLFRRAIEIELNRVK
ncbi:MAG: DsbA family protein, partial [Desulfovibrio sp.]|nr:DsbA family protein [Desulfovibrio sp.]